MSYAALGSTSFGKVFSTTLDAGPLGKQTFSVDVPLETLADSALKAAIPPAMKYAIAELKPQIPSLIGPALDQVGKYAIDRLWPQLRPLMEHEVDKEVEKATKRGVVIAGVLLVAIVGSAAWVVKTTKRRA